MSSKPLYKVKQPKLKIFCLELLHSFLTCLCTVQQYSFNLEEDTLEILQLQELRKKSPKYRSFSFGNVQYAY
jgi:hypothetical protein